MSTVSEMVRIGFRVDGGSWIGAGHLYRCLYLARRLSEKPIFFTKTSDFAREVVGDEVELVVLPPGPHPIEAPPHSWLGETPAEDLVKTQTALETHPVDLLVVDHYTVDQDWFDRIGVETLLLEDLWERTVSVRAVANYIADDRKWLDRLNRSSSTSWFGDRYFLLNPKYGAPVERVVGAVSTVLISIGGADQAGHTDGVYQTVTETLPEATVIVVGPLTVPLRDGDESHRRVTSLEPFYRRADLAIGSGGVSAYERVYFGLPTVVFEAAPNQRTVLQYLRNHSLAIETDLDSLGSTLASLDPAELGRISRRCLARGVGSGVSEIVDYLEEGIYLRPLELRDQPGLRRLLNEESVRAASFSGREFPAKMFSDLFHTKFFSHSKPSWVLEHRRSIGGYISLIDSADYPGTRLVGIAVSSRLRGRGYASRLLERATRETPRLVAEIKVSNEASRKLFEKHRFTVAERITRGELEFDRLFRIETPELVLGTAQLGLGYGVGNSDGKPDDQTALALLDRAWELGIRRLDTAAAYGDAERLIKLSPHRFRVGSKPAPDATDYTPDPRFESMILHRFTQYQTSLWNRLESLRFDGVLEKVGVSVYTPDEVSQLLTDPGVDAIQLPLNYLDRRWREPKLVEKLRSSRIRIDIRSIFLQGLLVIPFDRWPKLVGVDTAEIDRRIEALTGELGLSRLELAVSYVKSLDFVDGLVFGADNPTQLTETVELFRRVRLLTVDELTSVGHRFTDLPLAFLDPSRWERVVETD